MRLALQIAWRFLTSAKRQTLIIILGISIGVSVQVFIGSLILGLQKSLVDSTIGSSSHITVVHQEDNEFINDYMTTVSEIEASNEMIIAVSPTINLGGILENESVKKEIFFRGFDLDRANEIYDFNSKLSMGSTLPVNINDILLGIGLKDELNLSIGDPITIEINGDFRTLNVVGFFDFNVAQINRTWGISTLSTLQDILNDTSLVSSIELQIQEVFEAVSISTSLDQMLISRSLTTTNWMNENQELLSGLQGQSISSLMIQVFVIISVVLGISSVLAITVMQKSRQIGILKAMGIQDKDASYVFLFEGFILGIFGALGGVMIGLGLSYTFTTFALNPDGSPVVPLNIDSGFIALSAAIALIASTLAALIPAIKSSKLTVIEVIRNA
ncbi:ABC transporter permease [Peloplasma aerotolerans]|uniref:FtsX-like permease family protein n=1 Tax=Peloplasma aerotolerans TaxID=3044389 RepID=A0AAW6U5Z1_9MOLU|nr:FtsX-like permease family protein [Mariniplasma sp. M4Ah]MDI6452320.1 FtsX-like permease family protein [Mariniplasma sp. M4Ah]